MKNCVYTDAQRRLEGCIAFRFAMLGHLRENAKRPEGLIPPAFYFRRSPGDGQKLKPYQPYARCVGWRPKFSYANEPTRE